MASFDELAGDSFLSIFFEDSFDPEAYVRAVVKVRRGRALAELFATSARGKRSRRD
jgi:hypothetical protein